MGNKVSQNTHNRKEIKGYVSSIHRSRDNIEIRLSNQLYAHGADFWKVRTSPSITGMRNYVRALELLMTNRYRGGRVHMTLFGVDEISKTGFLHCVHGDLTDEVEIILEA